MHGMIMPLPQVVDFRLETGKLHKIQPQRAEPLIDPCAHLRRPFDPFREVSLFATDFAHQAMKGVALGVRLSLENAQGCAQTKGTSQLCGLLHADQCSKKIQAHGGRSAPDKHVQHRPKPGLFGEDAFADPQRGE